MNEFYAYLDAAILLLPLFFLIGAIAFRLLDNSGFLFLKKDILIGSSYISSEIIKEQSANTTDLRFQSKLKRVILYRKLYRGCLVLMVLSVPVSLWGYFSLF